MNADNVTWTNFLAPKYWGTWLIILLLRIFGTLPFKTGLSIGSVFGMLLYYLAKKRRRVTRVNIKLCFPEKTPAEQKNFAKDIFRANGIGFVETAWAYWGNLRSIKEKTTVKGAELLQKALAEKNGVIFHHVNHSKRFIFLYKH